MKKFSTEKRAEKQNISNKIIKIIIIIIIIASKKKTKIKIKK